MLKRSAAAAIVILALCPLESAGRISFRSKSRHSAVKAAQRRRLHSDDLIADPGTVEIDIGGFFASDHRAAPASVKWTPGGGGFWNRTELSVSFDSVAGSLSGDSRWVTQFSDRLGFAVTHVLASTENFSLAVAPQAAVPTRGDSGFRAGAGVLGKYDIGLSTIAGSATWTGATRPTDSNPAGDWEAGGTVVRRLGNSRLASRFSAYTNLFAERPTAGDGALAHSIGCLYAWKPVVQFDFTFRRVRNAGHPFDNQGLVTATFVLGHPAEKQWPQAGPL